MSDIQTKLERIRSLLDGYQVDALWLRLASSFAWPTGGQVYERPAILVQE